MIAGILIFLLKLLLFFALALILIFFMLLAMPVDYSISAAAKGSLKADAYVRWALLKASVLVLNRSAQVRIYLLGRELKLRRAEKKIKDKKKEKKRNWRSRKPGMEFFREAISFLKEILYALKPGEVNVKGRYGFDDPADTAVLSSLIMGVCSCLPGANIELCPVFDSEVIDMSLLISGRLAPITLVFIALRYLLKKEVRRVIIYREE
jgi:hypothetical protein